MPARRRTLALLPAGLLPGFTGCTSEKTGAERTETATPSPDPYSVDDLTISNWSDREQEVTVTVEPTDGEKEPFTDRVTLTSTDGEDSKAIYPDLEAMDGEATVRIEVADLGSGSHDWGGDAGDDHRGLTVIVKSDEIEFHEKVA